MVRRLAGTAAGLTIVLIVAGGVVTNTDSGLACPDWPTCYGSLVPRMTGNVAVEHTHRLIATAVGLLTVALVILALRKAAWLMAAFSVVLLGGAIWAARVKHVSGELPPAGVALVLLGFAGCAYVAWRFRDLACVALILVMLQGLLGGLTVLYKLPTLVLVMHLGTSMLFMSVLIAIAWGRPLSGGRLVWVTTAAIYLQILLGATVRHTGAGLVCTDLPYCRGAWWPSGVHPMVHLHMAHRAFAFVVAALVIWSSVKVARQTTLAITGPVLVVLQIVLGLLTILTFKDIVPLTAHLLVGALLLADYVSLLALTRPAPEPQLVQALA
ncbi:MAG: heme A synthase [Myxococcales bacterium]